MGTLRLLKGLRGDSFEYFENQIFTSDLPLGFYFQRRISICVNSMLRVFRFRYVKTVIYFLNIIVNLLMYKLYI